MSGEHPNIALLKRLDLRNLSASAGLFTDDFVWHFFNPQLPDLQGDYVGLAGLQAFFEKLGAVTGGSFNVEPVSITPSEMSCSLRTSGTRWPSETCRSSWMPS